MQTFPLRRGRWTLPLLGLFGASRPVVRLDASTLSVGMGVLGGARIPVERIVAVGTMRWPWWGGLGVRIARGLTTFAASSGRAVVVDLSEPVSLRAPLPWRTRRVAFVVEDTDGLVGALTALRGEAIRVADGD